ncbi:MAG TPA: PilN domain-containing protein [Candidatus Macondimonas sp.]|nr:PilN domain-containing protein [Candidatus Macondimonas sp.]
MAHHINLLPWREQQRKNDQRQFFISLAGAAIVALGGVFLVSSYVQTHIDRQNARNARIEAENRQLDTQIAEIRDLQKLRQSLIERMRIIEELQDQRTTSVHLFDELINTLPDGVTLLVMRQEGNQITLEGQAQSNARVSSYMKNLDGSPWFQNPQLVVIETKDGKNGRFAQFSLRVQLNRAGTEGQS